MKNFQRSDDLAGDHITTILQHLHTIRTCNHAMNKGIQKGLSGQSLLEYIQNNSVLL